MASSSPASHLPAPDAIHALPLRERVEYEVDDVLRSLPDIAAMTAEQRRGVIARYTAVLEGNFIYWMTATLLSVKTEKARAIIVENLREEIRDCHPGMMRRFALAAGAAPNEGDALAVHADLTKVRLFLGRLLPVPNLVTMAFFEGFIQRFMAYLADLARRQGSSEMEYTDVHGVCDITHTEELFHALEAELSAASPAPETDLFEGVYLLRNLLRSVIHADPLAASGASHAN